LAGHVSIVAARYGSTVVAVIIVPLKSIKNNGSIKNKKCEIAVKLFEFIAHNNT